MIQTLDNQNAICSTSVSPLVNHPLDFGQDASIVVYMETTHIDTIAASTIEVGDLIEVWDDVKEKYVIETVTDTEDNGQYIEVYTEENPDGWALLATADFRLFAYVYQP